MCGGATPRRGMDQKEMGFALGSGYAPHCLGQRPNERHSLNALSRRRRGKASPHIRRHSRSKQYGSDPLIARLLKHESSDFHPIGKVFLIENVADVILNRSYTQL